MLVSGHRYRTIWLKSDDDCVVQLIDQRALPHRFLIEDVTTVEQMAAAIQEMHVRGAGLIGAAAGYGMYLAMLAGIDPEEAAKILRSRRLQRQRRKARLRGRQQTRLRMRIQSIAARLDSTAWN